MKGTEYKWKLQSTRDRYGMYSVHKYAYQDVLSNTIYLMYTSTRNRMYFPIQSI